MSLTFKYQLLIIILVILAIQAKAQVLDEHTIQPDSIYRNLKVKRIIIYDNSPKDLSKIIDLDTNGHFIKIVEYDASYDKATRARKRIANTVKYIYNSKKQRIERIDSAGYSTSGKETDRTYYFYDKTGVLKTSTYENTKTEYSYNPFRSTEIRQSDSLGVTYRDSTEYDRGFYQKRWWGYSWGPTGKVDTIIRGNDTSRIGYDDWKHLKKFEWYEEDTNVFNKKGQLISSYENQRFTSVDGGWTPFKATITFSYYKNGLLKSGKGGDYKYEFYQ